MVLGVVVFSPNLVRKVGPKVAQIILIWFMDGPQETNVKEIANTWERKESGATILSFVWGLVTFLSLPLFGAVEPMSVEHLQKTNVPRSVNTYIKKYFNKTH